MKKSVLFTLISIVLFLAADKSFASHMFGGDLYYTWMGGNTYKITLGIYGDCSGGAFPSLHTSIGEVQIYKDTVISGRDSFYLDTTIQLPNMDTAGTEVSPVCPGELHNTNCNGGTLPGIKRFIFENTITLHGYSRKWVLEFDGNLTSSSAGRSGSITNLSSAGTMGLIDTLNNMDGPNSSATFTTIPTPFFCINQYQNYNPGAVDKDGDSLVFKLVPGFDPYAGSVVYLPPYTATAPLATSPGTFNFNSATGQISFKPNAFQKSLVVEQVSKYRNDTLIGTSMREMTFVVLSCSNVPPSGGITNVKGGNSNDSTAVKVCQSQGDLHFNISFSNPNGANVTVISAGVPVNAHYTVTGNNTKNPLVSFGWSVSNVPAGNYIFYVTLKDDNCPLNSNVTQAYTITVLPRPKMFYQQLTTASCNKKAIFRVAPAIPAAKWKLYIYNKAVKVIDSFINLTATDTVTDSLTAGKYQLFMYNENDCFQDSFVTITSFPDIVPTISVDSPTCFNYNNGRITYSATGVQPLTFSFVNGPNQTGVTGGMWDSLKGGTYHLIITDSLHCRLDTFIAVNQPEKIHLVPVTTPNNCEGQDVNGTASINAFGGIPPYRYLWMVSPTQTSQKITGLPNGTYQVFVQDAHNCKDSTIAMVAYDDCCKPFIPDAFTPNGDGRNDVFHMVFKGDFKLLEFSIYNRAGIRVYFNSSDARQGWDGRYNGIPQDMGTYYYYIKGICGNNGDHIVEFKGDMTLIR